MALALKDNTKIPNQNINSKQVGINICDTPPGNSLPLYNDNVVNSNYLDYIYIKLQKEVPLIPNRPPGAPLIENTNIPDNIRAPSEISPCSKGFVQGICQSGHHFANQLLCNKEYCSTCGKNWSYAHQRRYFSWVPKLKTMKSVYYLVISPPKETWHLFKDRKKLNEFRKYIKRFMIYKGYEKGLIRWHWFGDCKVCKGKNEDCLECNGTGAGKEFYPHLNLLFDSEYISDLSTWKYKFAWKLSKMFDIDVKQCIVNGAFYENEKQKLHKLRYVTRATFRIYNDEISNLLFRYHTGVTWGSWKGKIDSNDVNKLEKSICPLCDSHIDWTYGIKRELDQDEYIHIKAGYWIWNKKELYHNPKCKSP
ncbi:MAG: hypothetical protein IID03_11445 [Candidatus Dadabacteria bacterium]|nr:hypothetical protein [Candidatus Dadabacteria bacterium]